MKKIVSVVLALVLLFALAVSASALTATVSYKDGVLYWDVTEFDTSVGVYANGQSLGGSPKGHKTFALKPGDKVTISDFSSSKDFYPVKEEPTAVPATATPAPTDTPAPTATPTVEPTATPTVEPTKAPTQAPTTAPTQRPTTRPTKTPSSDVPKTGDSANAVYVMGGLMLLAGACLVLSRKVSK